MRSLTDRDGPIARLAIDASIVVDPVEARALAPGQSVCRTTSIKITRQRLPLAEPGDRLATLLGDVVRRVIEQLVLFAELDVHCHRKGRHGDVQIAR